VARRHRRRRARIYNRALSYQEIQRLFIWVINDPAGVPGLTTGVSISLVVSSNPQLRQEVSPHHSPNSTAINSYALNSPTPTPVLARPQHTGQIADAIDLHDRFARGTSMPDSREKASMLTNLPPPRTRSGDRTFFLPQLALVVSMLVMSTAILLH
jgi:hypothetical protein